MDDSALKVDGSIKNTIDLFIRTTGKNRILLREYNNKLADVSSFDVWEKNLIKRSRVFQKIYVENEEVLSEISRILKDPMSRDTADYFCRVLEEFGRNVRSGDVGIYLEIIKTILPVYIKDNDAEKVIFLSYLMGYILLEYYSRFDREHNIDDAYRAYQEVISYRDQYASLSRRARYKIFASYFNMIGTSIIEKKEYRIQAVPLYQEAVTFYHSNLVQLVSSDDSSIKEVFAEICEAVLANYCSYIVDEESFRNYYEAVKGFSFSEFPHYKTVIDLVKKRYDGAITERDFISSLIETYENSFIRAMIPYDKSRKSLNRFNDAFELSIYILKEISQDPSMKGDVEGRERAISKPIFDFLRSVPYTDFMTYFDDACHKLFSALLPYCRTTAQKLNLLMDLIIERQPDTYFHSVMVSRIAEMIASFILKDRREIFARRFLITDDSEFLGYIRDCGLLHDIGKCLIAYIINLQTRPLKDWEFDFIRLHPTKALELVDGDHDFDIYRDIMLGHHRTYDGRGGYPIGVDNRRSGYRIIISLIQIADSLDAATDTIGRVYSKGKSFEAVLDELIRGRDTTYDPEIVDIIITDNSLKKELKRITSRGRNKIYYKCYKDIAQRWQNGEGRYWKSSI